MKITAFLLAALPAATSAFAPFSIANGLPIRRSVAKFTDEQVPEDAVTKAAEGKNNERVATRMWNTIPLNKSACGEQPLMASKLSSNGVMMDH